MGEEALVLRRDKGLDEPGRDVLVMNVAPVVFSKKTPMTVSPSS